MSPSAAAHLAAPPMTAGDALARAAKRLANAGVAAPRLDAALLLGAAMGMRREEVLLAGAQALGRVEASRYTALIARRAAREPVSRILGVREFWSLPLAIDAHVFDPRPESETVVEAGLALIPDRGAAMAVLDLGAGSGALLLALLSELPRADGIGVDVSPGAVVLARANAAALGLGRRCRFIAGDWGSAIRGRFDLILANPPYVARADIARLGPEVRHEPERALAGGADGLDGYRALLPDVARLLTHGGAAVVELGAGQGAAVTALCRARGLYVESVRRDLSGIARAAVIRRGGVPMP